MVSPEYLGQQYCGRAIRRFLALSTPGSERQPGSQGRSSGTLGENKCLSLASSAQRCSQHSRGALIATAPPVSRPTRHRSTPNLLFISTPPSHSTHLDVL